MLGKKASSVHNLLRVYKGRSSVHTEESKHDDETFMVVSDEVPAYSR